jgi:predicted dehydrogenase
MSVRWGVAATGGIARGFAEAMTLVDGGHIAGVGSRSAEMAKAFADDFGIPRAHGTYADLVNDPELDVIYIATPHSHHAWLTIAALDAGKHVLCEKPFALNAHEARAMVDASRRNDRFLMEAIWSRFLPAYVRLMDVLAEGRIGDPLMVEADFGFRMPVIPTHRLFDSALGGGALLDLGIYPLQLCSLVFGAPERVAAVGHIGETAVDEVVAAVLHHRDGGIGVVKAATRVGLSCTARISGTDGNIEIPAFMHCPQQLVVNGECIDGSYQGEGLRFQVEEVQRCLEAGARESSVVPLAESIQLAETMDDIRRQIGVVYACD